MKSKDTPYGVSFDFIKQIKEINSRNQMISMLRQVYLPT